MFTGTNHSPTSWTSAKLPIVAPGSRREQFHVRDFGAKIGPLLPDIPTCKATQALLMSLYYDASSVLTGENLRGSLKSRIYNNNAGLKSKPAHIYALISECAKYDAFIAEVVDKAGILAHEPKVCTYLRDMRRRR
jgi:hypothetical protein